MAFIYYQSHRLNLRVSRSASCPASYSNRVQGPGLPTQIGLGRIITDESSFAYLTDVFIIPEHQASGLGRWLLECINETLGAWPDLRRAVLYTRGAHAIEFYKKTMGMTIFETGTNGLVLMEKQGNGSPYS